MHTLRNTIFNLFMVLSITSILHGEDFLIEIPNESSFIENYTDCKNFLDNLEVKIFTTPQLKRNFDGDASFAGTLSYLATNTAEDLGSVYYHACEAKSWGRKFDETYKKIQRAQLLLPAATLQMKLPAFQLSLMRHIKEWVRSKKVLDHTPIEAVLIHNDLIPFNIMTDRTSFKLVDWPSSGMGDAFWDFIDFTVFLKFDDVQSKSFMTEYFGRDLTIQEWNRFVTAFDKLDK